MASVAEIAYISFWVWMDCFGQFLGCFQPHAQMGSPQRGGSHSGEAWLLSICDEKSHTLSHASTAGATHRGHINRNRNKLKAFLFEALHMSMCQRWLMTSDYCREPSVRKVGFERKGILNSDDSVMKKNEIFDNRGFPTRFS